MQYNSHPPIIIILLLVLVFLFFFFTSLRTRYNAFHCAAMYCIVFPRDTATLVCFVIYLFADQEHREQKEHNNKKKNSNNKRKKKTK
mmetsp:Transcript_23839/g.44523  ORF Transcript_23839/g.44523 Transcript_23839/m.44523 type:complete len:87 (+) Transcript_23839:55-315(+)